MNCDSRSYQKDQLKIDSRAGMSGSAAAACDQCPAGRVFQYQVGSGRVLDKIPGSGSGSGRVRVSKNMIRYFRVCRVFLGLPIYTRVI